MNDEHKDLESCNNNNQQQEEVEEELQGLVVISSNQKTTVTDPLEITSRQSFNSTDSVEDINSPLPSKRLFFDISNRTAKSSSCCIQKKKSRRIKSILAIVIAIIIP